MDLLFLSRVCATCSDYLVVRCQRLPGSHCDRVHVMMMVSVASIAVASAHGENGYMCCDKKSQTSGSSLASHTYPKLYAGGWGNHAV